MANLAEIAGVTARSPKFPAAVTGAAAVRASSLGDMNLFATIQGQRTLEEHLFAMSVVLPQIIRALVGYFGVVLAETAKGFHFPNIDTGDTYRSIKAGPVIPLPGGAAINVSVSTPQAKFLEFGFVHYKSGQWIFNPFMIPAADAVTPIFVGAVRQAAAIAGGLRFFRGPAAKSPANNILGSVRGALYSYSKYAGDIQALGFTGLSQSRGLALQGAQGIGNVQALQAGTLSARFTRIAVGRFGGRFGRTGAVSGFQQRQGFTGPSARLYNRIGGRAFGGALSKIRF